MHSRYLKYQQCHLPFSSVRTKVPSCDAAESEVFLRSMEALLICLAPYMVYTWYFYSFHHLLQGSTPLLHAVEFTAREQLPHSLGNRLTGSLRLEKTSSNQSSRHIHTARKYLPGQGFHHYPRLPIAAFETISSPPEERDGHCQATASSQ